MFLSNKVASTRGHSNQPISTFLRDRVWFFMCITTLISPMLVACERSVGTEKDSSIVVDRQVLFSNFKTKPNSITRVKPDGYLVAGGGPIAAALLANANGELVWQYLDSPDLPRQQGASESAFFGGVLLANGQYLFCGSEHSKEHGTVNRITILDDNGRLVDQRAAIPKSDQALVSSAFTKCFYWGGGIVLTGYASNGRQGYTWILNLDSNGREISQTLLPGTMGTESVVDSESSLVFIKAGKIADQSISISRVTAQGKIVTNRSINGTSPVQLRSLVSGTTVRVISYGDGGNATLYTLDNGLHDAVKPIETAQFDVTQGCGYALADGSIVLFGRKTNAAIAWISEVGAYRAFNEFDDKYKSFVVSDAVAVSQKEFVTVRYSASVDPNANGLVMSWVTLK